MQGSFQVIVCIVYVGNAFHIWRVSSSISLRARVSGSGYWPAQLFSMHHRLLLRPASQPQSDHTNQRLVHCRGSGGRVVAAWLPSLPATWSICVATMPSCRNPLSASQHTGLFKLAARLKGSISEKQQIANASRLKGSKLCRWPSVLLPVCGCGDHSVDGHHVPLQAPWLRLALSVGRPGTPLLHICATVGSSQHCPAEGRPVIIG
jgi:hypothetical protein